MAEEHPAGSRPARAAAQAPFRPVTKAYQQVAEQLHELIESGALSPGDRLPTEVALARSFAVSRATVREALRSLTAQGLLETTRGPGGGSYVTAPTIDHVSEFLRLNLNLLSDTEELSLDDFVEARRLLDVAGARAAAQRRTDEDLEEIMSSIPPESSDIASQERFVQNKEFHEIVLRTTGNKLLLIAAQPIFVVLQRGLARSMTVLGPSFHEEVTRQHRIVAEAIAARDPDAAAAEMDRHIDFLVPAYEDAWTRRDGKRR